MSKPNDPALDDSLDVEVDEGLVAAASALGSPQVLSPRLDASAPQVHVTRYSIAGPQTWTARVTTQTSNGCVWAEVGGKRLPGAVNQFGRSSKTEFGTTLLVGDYPTSPPGTVTTRYNNFRRILNSNPCPA